MKKRTILSILTITRWCRHEYLTNLYTQIKNQKGLPLDTEWVIVDASKSDEEQEKLKEFISKLSKIIHISYYSTTHFKPSDRIIGRMRQYGNEKCKGSFIVVMDDDDYYPPTRVKHAIQTLKRTNLAGCTNHIIADYDIGLIFQLKGFHNKHAVNCTFAYTRNYLKTHSYDETKTHAEESSFTNNFSEPMIQLNPYDTIIQTSHPGNTFNKRGFLLGMMQGNTDIGRILQYTPNQLLPKSFLESLPKSSALAPPIAEVTIFCGLDDDVWDPRFVSTSNKHFLVNLASRLSKTVCVYANFPFEQLVHEGVTYRHVNMFLFRNQKYQHLILWPPHGIAALKSPYLTSNKTMVVTENRETLKSWLEFDVIRSKIQHIVTIEEYGIIRHPEFDSEIEREKHHFLYADPSGWGLGPLLEVTWPVLLHLCPTATLHICQNINMIYQKEHEEKLKGLLAVTKGVIDHGPVHHIDLIRLKHMCAFHLLYAPHVDSPGQHPLWIQESLEAGCQPILHKDFPFDSDNVIKVDEGFTRHSYLKVARHLYDILLDPPKLTTKRKGGKTWQTIAQKFLDEYF